MALTIQELGSLGEFLGSIVVLVTLGYLAVQTRQNTRAISAQIDTARAQMSLMVGSLPLTSPALAEALDADRMDDAPEIEQQRRAHFWTAAMGLNQWQFIHGRQGLAVTYNEAGLADGVTNLFRMYRSYDEFWERLKPFFLPEFVAFVEEQRAKAA